MATTYRQRNVYAPLDGERMNTARACIANLIIDHEDQRAGVTSRVADMGSYQIKPEFLPLSTMSFERQTLRAIYALDEDGVAPTPEILLERLRMDFPDAAAKLDQLLGYRTEPPQVTRLAFAVGDWIQAQRGVLAIQEAAKIFAGPEGNYRDKFDEVMKLVATLAPIGTSISTKTAAEMGKAGLQKQIEREDIILEGKLPGPNWPWKGLNEKIPALKKGEMTTWLAKSKHGKSTVVLLLAEHMAYALDGFCVSVIHVETSHDSIQDRLMARKLDVKPASLRIPGDASTKKLLISVREEPWKSKYEGVVNQSIANEKAGKFIWYHHSPGITPSEMKALISADKAKAEALGKELVVILDYYQEVDWSEFGDDSGRALNNGATWLKNTAEALGVYFINFAQFDNNSDYNAKKSGFGGQVVIMRSQNVIRIEREDATDTLRMVDPKTGQQVRDGLGQLKFFHEVGNPSSEATFNVLLSNDDNTGPVPIRFVNGYFDITDRPAS